MMPTTHHWVARFRTEHEDFVNDLKVEGWDDEGNALVVVRGTGTLRAANSLANFIGVFPDGGPVTTLIPGGGWTVEHYDNDGGKLSDPVVAFGFSDAPYPKIFTAASDGVIVDAPEIDGVNVCLTPPGGWPSYIPAAQGKTA